MARPLRRRRPSPWCNRMRFPRSRVRIRAANCASWARSTSRDDSNGMS
ncbi:hypothetical protein [Cupriavidus sp. YR651]